MSGKPPFEKKRQRLILGVLSRSAYVWFSPKVDTRRSPKPYSIPFNRVRIAVRMFWI